MFVFSKYILQSLVLLLLFGRVDAQKTSRGRWVVEKFVAKSIKGNPAGEDSLRRLTIYLPPGYEIGKKKYPVIYFLHGFTSTDSSFVERFGIKGLADTAIMLGELKPVILVFPNSYTSFKGSFYTNSSLTGNWADYIAKDVVNYVDRKFRTIPTRNSRGICGHSMGGNGAIKIGMLFSNVFGAVYALSPARLNWGDGLTETSPYFTKVREAKTMEDITKDFFILEVADLARTYSPNPDRGPFFVDLPYEPRGNSLVRIDSVYEKWNRNLPITMIDSHIDALKSLNALKLDWGRNENFPFIPIACLEFSRKLESLHITHYAESYIGDHADHIGGRDGRIYAEVFPFFNRSLKF